MGPGPRGNVGCFEGGRSAPTAQLCAGEVSTEICTFVGRIDCQAVLSPNAEEQNNCFGWAMLCSFHGLPDDFEETLLTSSGRRADTSWYEHGWVF